MVAKLIKHELHALLRVAVYPAAGVVLFALLLRVSTAVSDEYNFFTWLLLALYVGTLIATLLIGLYIGIRQFYRSLFTGEGYMTLSLPVGTAQLILAKLIAAIVVFFASALVCLLTGLLFLIGQETAILSAAEEFFFYLRAELEAQTGVSFAGADGLYLFEGICYLLLCVPSFLLVWYAAVSVGQLFSFKNRKWVTALLALFTVVAFSALSNYALTPLLLASMKVSVHLGIWLMIAFSLAVCVGCFFLVRYLLKRKINLIV